MIDFNKISPEDFELLSEDLLRSLGFTIESRPARGPDKGKDILATRYVTDIIGNVEEERYLVECKHLSKSNKSVLESDIGNFQAKLSLHKANRYLLITTTIPSETVKDHLGAISRDPTNPYKAGFWARHDLARLLQENSLVRNRYFLQLEPPKGAASIVATEITCWMQAKGYVVAPLKTDSMEGCFNLPTFNIWLVNGCHTLCKRRGGHYCHRKSEESFSK